MARKYVMATRPDGLSDVIIDEEVADAGIVDLWINYETPAELTSTKDPSKSDTIIHEPPDGGAIFRVCKFTKDMDTITPEQIYAMHQQIHSVHIPSLEYLRAAKHPSMHKTDTLNYFVVVSGRLWALSEGRDVLLEPGDYIVQKGCMHGWRVESDEPALLVAILIDGQPS